MSSPQDATHARSLPPIAARFRSVVLDVDSTLSGIEGIDWLAQQRDTSVADRVAALTTQAMNGEMPLDAVYGARLEVIRPRLAEIEALGAEYQRQVAPGARAGVERLRAAGVRVVLVSGGIRRAIEPLATTLGVDPRDLHAVDLYWNQDGEYAGFDRQAPLASQIGKLTVVRALKLPAPVLAVGDGSTDVAMRPAVDAFAAYTGFVKRASVVARADMSLATFDDLVSAVL